MFVKSNMSIEVVYNTNGNAIVLKPKAITYVADDLVTPKELINCYGSRISIMSSELVEQVIREEAAKCPVETTVTVEVEGTTVPADETTTVETEGTTEPTVEVEGTTETTVETEPSKPVEPKVAKQSKKATGKKANKKSNK
jgi:hypothetical protein